MKRWKALALTGVMATTVIGAACGETTFTPPNVTADEYKITVACQTEMGEVEVLEVLKAAYEAKNPDVKIEIKTFSGDGFEQYMYGIASEPTDSPNIIWTADTYHSQWDQYFTDLRPYYEASAETDYSLYYETMLDAAATHGYFKPTKNYTGEFRKDDKDTNSDGYESYENHSQYGLYYAPRDYNKPAILCNTHLFDELDSDYELTYKTKTGEAEMPADYKTTRARLTEVVNGTDWDSMSDLYAFAKMIAERMVYIANSADFDRNMGKKWNNRAVLNLFLEWEPTYTTIMDSFGARVFKEDGSLNLSAVSTQLEEMHAGLFPADEQVAGLLTTTTNGVAFKDGGLFMNVCSRPVVLGYGNTFRGYYNGEACLETISLPVENVAAGNSGYAISNVWDGAGITVNGVYKSYNDLSWDFIKFIITEEGQEAAGATGLNIPVLKKLYSEETNGGVTPAWRKVEMLGSMSNDAWVAGGELRQDTFNIFKETRRLTMRNVVRTFFGNIQKSNYNEGSLAKLIEATEKNYKNNNPSGSLR